MERYNREYSHGSVTFFLSDYTPNIEECRFLILKIVEQATRDYISLFGSNVSSEKALWETAHGFIFDDEYRIMWGNTEMGTEDLVGIVDVDVHYLRERVRKQFKERHNNGSQEERREARGRKEG
jgi:hypothetical protein